MSFHTCPVSGCVHQVDNARLMCAVHWRLVSKRTQREVYTAWERLQRARTPENATAHRQACERAIREASR